MTKVVEYIKRVKVKYKMPFNANGKLRDDERSTKHNLKPTLLLFIADYGLQCALCCALSLMVKIY